MLVSICIPVYNGEKSLDNCLISLKRQSAPIYEIIIQDDGSKDGSKQIIEKYHDLPINYEKNDENVGMIKNWNKCIKRCTGDIITFYIR